MKETQNVVGSKAFTRLPIEVLRASVSYDATTGMFRRDGKPIGSIDPRGYRVLTVAKKSLLGHRVAWAMHYGEWPSKQIDHINGVRHDNRIENLRTATAAENGRNRKRGSANRSGFKGVWWSKSNKKWVAAIRGQHLGSFDRAEDAHAAYKKAALAQFGTFANDGGAE